MNLVRYTKEVNDNEVIYLLFDSANCRICQELKEKLKNINSDFTIYLIDAYEHFEIAQKYSLVGTPCFLKVDNMVEIDRLYGNKSMERLIKFIDED